MMQSDTDILREILRKHIDEDSRQSLVNGTLLWDQDRGPTPTLSLDRVREAMRMMQKVAPKPIPRILVSSMHSLENPVLLATKMDGEFVILSVDNAKELHGWVPLRLLRRLSLSCGEYVLATEFDGPIPMELPLPPFEVV